jgi:hypothetical protein
MFSPAQNNLNIVFLIKNLNGKLYFIMPEATDFNSFNKFVMF